MAARKENTIKRLHQSTSAADGAKYKALSTFTNWRPVLADWRLGQCFIRATTIGMQASQRHDTRALSVLLSRRVAYLFQKTQRMSRSTANMGTGTSSACTSAS